MKYTVIWEQAAQDALAELWSTGPDRAAIAAAADTIDQILKFDAGTKGEAEEGDTRSLVCHPLAVLFLIHELDCQVSVYAVWRWDP